MLVTIGKALKEWAVVVRAMDLGFQTILLRKGGIVEENRHFALESGEFFLLPTYTHQEPDVLQQRFRALMDDPFCKARSDDLVPITHWAKVTDVLVVRSLDQLRMLATHYVWTPEYASQRFQWKPKYPLNLLVLRVFRLPQACLVRWDTAFGGCRSWADMGEPIPTSGSSPVLSDAEFNARVREILRVLNRT